MALNRNGRRLSLKEGRRRQALPPGEFKDVTLEAYQRHLLVSPESNFFPDAVYSNNHYIVQCFWPRTMLGLHVAKAMVRRSDGAKCGWLELQG